MSNPTELLDLDRLEALARAATPGPWAYQEDSDAYTHIVRPTHTPGRIVHHYSQDTSGVVEANARFTAGANPAAVLALITLARRAKPEGEAPQAVPVGYLMEWRESTRKRLVFKQLGPWQLKDMGNPTGIIYTPLGPITAPAAQQAESGAQALSDAQCDEAAAKAMDRVAASHDMHALHINPDVRAHDDLRRELVRAGAALAAQSQGAQAAMRDCPDCDGTGRISGVELCARCNQSGILPAVQQAAAPGALALLNADELAALRRFDETCQDGEGYDVPKAMMQRLAAIGVVRRTSGSYYETTDFGMRVLDQPAPSAPGTPEAPAGWKKALHAAVSAIYFDDSSDFRSALGSVVRHLDADLAGELLGNPKAAYDRSAAQLDGGQGEGS
jgi:hypothetical protein